MLFTVLISSCLEMFNEKWNDDQNINLNAFTFECKTISVKYIQRELK